MREPLYWSLVPVYPSDPDSFSIATAAVVSCIVTGKMLDGMGGPGYALAPEVVREIDMTRPNAVPKVLVEVSRLEELKGLTNIDQLRDQIDLIIKGSEFQ